MYLIEQEMPGNKAGKLLGEYSKRLWTIFNYWIGIAYNEADYIEVEAFAVDETSSMKAPDFVTVPVDMDKSAVVHVTKGKGSDKITQIAEYLENKDTPRSSIQKICTSALHKVHFVQILR